MGLLGAIGLDDIFHEVGETVRQVLPDPDARREFDYKMEELKDRANARVSEEIRAQLEVNKAEASHASIFVAGWRPAIGWTCAAALGWNFLLVHIVQLFGVTGSMLPTEGLITLVLTMLGASGIRSYELTKGVSRDTLKGPRLQGQGVPTPLEPPAPSVQELTDTNIPAEDKDAPWNRR